MSAPDEPVTVVPATPSKGFKIPPRPDNLLCPGCPFVGTPRQRPFTFHFGCMDGYVDRYGVVAWGGLSFQREAAIGGLQAAIAAAEKRLSSATATPDDYDPLGR